MKTIETILHRRRAHRSRTKNLVPTHVWRIAARYDLIPGTDETR